MGVVGVYCREYVLEGVIRHGHGGLVSRRPAYRDEDRVDGAS